ncbi:MAG: RagB/SusD family nutrient uptake outer membrane protein [Bacteroidales bacterium]|nr:RagB/SusD family nutrient uptake outer membrane protein [Bacteroidales bacterium]
MKTFKYITAAIALGFMALACQTLDLEPKGLIYENVLLSSDNGVKKYLALAYQDLPIEDFNYGQNGDQRGYATVYAGGWHGGNQWQAQKSSAASAAAEACGRGLSYGDSWGYWPYDRIRDINNMIEQLPNYKDNYKEEEYNALMGEAHFLRAFYYFGIVKRYGGVPLVDKVMDPKAPAEELQLPRSTEYDSWKFIYEDLKFAMENATASKAELGRANRYAAAALMSRAMLYAGSIAKYSQYIPTTGNAVDAGLMTMPEEYAEEFFQYSYDACKFLKDAGFKLLEGADKEQNYIDVFLKDNSATEDIMVKQYGPKTTTPWNTNLFHCWDAMTLPIGTNLSSSVGAAIQPSWELISLFELPAITDENGNPVRFDDPSDIWKNGMEPRCKANFFFSGMTESVSGTVIDVQAGVYSEYPGTAADGTEEVGGSVNAYTDQYRHRMPQPGQSKEINGQTVKVSGAHGLAEGVGDEGYTYMGTFIRKYIDTGINPADRQLFGSTQSWKVFRYGEILCNWAEAAYELGLIRGDENLKKEAIEHVNELRRRAGATEYQYNGAPADLGTAVYGFPIDENLQYIRDERARELCFENHRIFDIRRWRVADIMFQDGVYTHALLPYYVLSEGKWIYLNEVNLHGRKVTFDKKWYYEQMPGGEISKNPNIIRNDGY